MGQFSGKVLSKSADTSYNSVQAGTLFDVIP
jgi:hypothetical protein